MSLFTGILILTVFSFAYAQQKPSVAFSSFERAKQILDAAIAAHGGLENIRRADKIARSITNRSIIRSDKVILLPRRSAGIPRGSENFD
jgi:hypothetical protein